MYIHTNNKLYYNRPKNAINITKATGGQIKKIIKDFDIEETTPTSKGMLHHYNLFYE